MARALFAAVTARVAVTDDAVADYHARNPLRFAAPCPGQHGWRAPAAAAPPLDQVRRAITEHLLGPRAAAPSGCGWTRAGTPWWCWPRL